MSGMVPTDETDRGSESREGARPPPELTSLPPDHWDTVFDSAPEITRPGKFLGMMRADLIACRELAWRLFVRNITAMYRQTILGWFWAFAPVIVMTATFVFLRSRNIVSFDELAVPYSVYVFTGMILWQTFYEAVLAPIKQVMQARTMLGKIHFPREALILAGFYETLFNSGLRLLLWIPAAFYMGFNPFVIGWVFVPGFLALVGLGIGIGVLLVPLAALYQDVEKGLPILLTLGMFLTPVFYPIGADPQTPFFLLNPVTAILDTARSGLLGIAPVLPGAALLWSLFVILSLGAGWILFRLALPHIVSRMPAS